MFLLDKNALQVENAQMPTSLLLPAGKLRTAQAETTQVQRMTAMQ